MRPNALHCLLQGLLTAAAVAITAPMIAGAAETAPAVVTADALPPGAAPPSLIRKVESRFSTFVGGAENADSLAIGLRNGTPVRLTGFDANDQPVTVTFTPATGHMGVGNVMHSLNVAGRVLVREGIVEPTPEQLTAALMGGTITRADGTTVELAGVLQMRADGMGWGRISKELGVKHSSGHGPSSAPFIPAQQVNFIAKDDDRRRARALVADDKGGAAARTADVRRDGGRGNSSADRHDATKVERQTAKPEGMRDGGRPDKVDKVVSAERPARIDRLDRPDRPEKPDKPERPEKPEKPERPEKPEHGGKH
jgi:hypothetical protein